MKPFDASGAFCPVGKDGDLRRLAVRGAGVAVLSQGLAFAVQVIATVVLARLLTPADFGVVTMVTTFSLLLTSFGLNGFSEAVLQREEIDQFLASNLFWINMGCGLLLTLGFAGAGSMLARFYGDQRITHVTLGMSVTIFLTSASVLHLALLKRAMRFSAVSANDILARAMSVAVSILLGLAGLGYWALVAGAIAQPLITSIGAWSLCQWAPRLPRRAPGTGSMVRFAMNIYGRFTVNYSARNMDNLLVGWRFDAQALGSYKKAYDLFALSANQIVAPLTVVAVSALSRLNRQSIQYRRSLLSAIAVMALVGMGLSGELTLVGKDMIRLVLGPGWETAGQIFTFFGPGIGAMLIYGTHGWIHLSIGTPERWFRWVIVEFTVTGLLFALGLRWGPLGIAVAWTASFWILTIPAVWYAGRPIQLGIRPVIAAVWKYILASALAGCASAAVIRWLPSFSGVASLRAVPRIAMTSLVFGSLYIGAIILFDGGSAPLSRILNVLRDMVPWIRLSRLSPVLAATTTPD